MRILVTGGGGFIGAWLIKGLVAAGIDVRVFDRSEDRRIGRQVLGEGIDAVDWVGGDINDARALEKAAHGCEQIAHLAALLTPACTADPTLGMQTNLGGTLNVFEAARIHGMRQVLYMSSASVYGPDNGVDPFPITLYGVWKLAMEGAARCYLEDHGIASAGYRPLVVYGPGRDVGISAGPSVAIESAVRGTPYTISFSGRTDLIYVEDVVSAYVEAAINGVNGARTYTITGEVAEMTEWCLEILQHCPDAKLEVTGAPLPVSADIEPGTLRQDFPNVPLTGIAEGIEKTVKWHLAHSAKSR